MKFYKKQLTVTYPLNPWSDISHLKKSVPKLPMRFRTLVPANNVRKDSGEIRTLAGEKNKSACTFPEKCLHNPERVLALPENGHKAKCNIFFNF